MIGSSSPSSTSILVADDDEDHRYVLRYLLEREGFSVSEAGDGDAVLAFMEARTPALIILDSLLPRRTGFECLRTIKSDPRFRGVPVMICSGRGDLPYVLQCSEAGAAGFLHKPVAAENLIDRIRHALRG